MANQYFAQAVSGDFDDIRKQIAVQASCNISIRKAKTVPLDRAVADETTFSIFAGRTNELQPALSLIHI